MRVLSAALAFMTCRRRFDLQPTFRDELIEVDSGGDHHRHADAN